MPSDIEQVRRKLAVAVPASFVSMGTKFRPVRGEFRVLARVPASFPHRGEASCCRFHSLMLKRGFI